MTRHSLFAILAATALAGCDTGPKSGRGFSLPDGDVSRGQAVFVAHRCESCHSVAGLDGIRGQMDPEMSIELGGVAPRIASYGELVTSVINPSHRLARGYPTDAVSDDGTSKMANYNDALTVAELIDLVAFLQAQYELPEYRETYYGQYHYE